MLRTLRTAASSLVGMHRGLAMGMPLRLPRHTTTTAAIAETRCGHCHVTFATAAELSHHSTHHCFPHEPDEVLRRFPVGTEVMQPHLPRLASHGIVVGKASNSKMAHCCVSVKGGNGVTSDVMISRLVLQAEPSTSPTKLPRRFFQQPTSVRCVLLAAPALRHRVGDRLKHDWMRDAEREARGRLPRGKGKDGISAVQGYVMDSLQHEIKAEMMAQTVRLEERLTAAVEKLHPLRAQAEEEATHVKRFNRERSTALRLLHEYGVQREAATGQAMSPEMASAFKIPRAL